MEILVMTRRLSLADMRAMQTNLLAFTQQAAREQNEQGYTQYNMFGKPLFFIFRPELIRELLVKQSDKLHRDPFVSRAFRRVLGNGVFMAEGKAWKRQRRLVQPAFHAMRIQKYVETMAAYTREMVSGWTEGEVVAVNTAFNQLTMRIIAKTMYGVDLASQTAELGRLMQIILEVMEEQLSQTIIWPMWVPTAQNRRQGQALREVRALLGQIVQERRASGRDEGDLLSMLLLARDEAGQPMEEELLLDELITLFFAGHETTAVALTWLAHLLATHPEATGRLTAELDQTLGQRPITFADLADLPYLDAVIKETLRLYPPAFGFGREVQEPFTIGPTQFPRQAVLLFSSYATHRDPTLYDQPDRFWPDRFLQEDTRPDKYAYFPFGVGSRICLGNMFAQMEAAVICATLLQTVQLTRADELPVEMDTVVTLRPKQPLHLRVRHRP
jgi:cytochrome P450